MLLSFSLSNYRSFLNKQLLTLRESTDTKTPINLNVIYGWNAAGKSNILKAMRDAKRIITDSDYKVKAPFFSKFGNDDKISTFEFEFLIDSFAVFRYVLKVKTGIECVSQGYSIVSEALYDISNAKNIKTVYSEEYKSDPDTIKTNPESYVELQNNLTDITKKKKDHIASKKELESRSSAISLERLHIEDALDDIKDEYLKKYEDLIEERNRLAHDSIPDETIDIQKRRTRFSQVERELRENPIFIQIKELESNRDALDAESKMIQSEMKRLDSEIGYCDKLAIELNDKIKRYIDSSRTNQSFKEIVHTKLYEYTRNGVWDPSIDDFYQKSFKQIYYWFADTLTIISTDDFIFLPKDSGYLVELSNIIRNFDVGISKIWYTQMDGEERQKIEKILIEREKERIDFCNLGSEKNISMSFIAKDLSGLYYLSFWHGKMQIKKIIAFHSDSNSSKNDLNDESDGTTRLIELATMLIDDGEEKVYIIDELDRCMHPLLTAHIIEEFIEMTESENTVSRKQLIFTSHEHTLLKDLFQPEEVWEVVSDDGVSVLKHVSEENKNKKSKNLRGSLSC